MTTSNRWKFVVGGGLVLLVAGITVPLTLRNQTPANHRTLDPSKRPDHQGQSAPAHTEQGNLTTKVPQSGKSPKVPALTQSPPRSDKTEPTKATRAPMSPMMVVPLGGGRLLSPGAPGMFHHNEAEDWLQIVKPAEGRSAANKLTGCT